MLKLHGSLGWGQCFHCRKIIPVPIGNYVGNIHIYNLDQKYIRLTPLDYLGKHKDTLNCCDHTKFSSDPFIVPPTWQKTIYQENLRSVWSQAAKEFSDAEYIIIIGYSLPESDLFFRYLYSLGSVGDSIIKSFWVFDPDEKVHEKFNKLLGVESKDRFKPEAKVFKDAINIIREAILGRRKSPGIWV